MLVGYFIATYYSVIAGWTLAYIFKAGNGFGGASPQDVAQQFDALLADPVTMMKWLRDAAVRVEKAEKMTPEAMSDRFTVGVLADVEKPVYTEEYEKIRQEAKRRPIG